MNTNPLVTRVRTAYSLLVQGASHLQSPFLFVIRAYWGFSFCQTGWGKLRHLSDVTEYFGHELHIPFPAFNALLASVTEFFGGLLLILGLASRLISLPLTFLLCVAYLTADPDALHDADKFVKATEFPFLFTVLVVLTCGPGVFSIDYLLGKKFGPTASKTTTANA